MSRKPRDLTGQRFGQLTVIQRSERRHGRSGHQWVCRCDCGRYLVCRVDNLTTGHSTKCSVCAHNVGYGSVFINEVVEV